MTDESIQPETYAGLGVGALPVLTALTHRRGPNWDKVRQLSQKRFMRAIRPGDIVISRAGSPTSGFRLLTTPISGDPVYHAEMAYKSPRGLRMALIESDPNRTLKEMFDEGRDAAVIARPRFLKNLPEQTKKKLWRQAAALSNEPFDTRKLTLTPLADLTIPHSERTGRLPVICRGNICSTGPAQAMRQSGIHPHTRALPGFETAKDYLRNPKNYEIVARTGVKLPAHFDLTRALPARLGVAMGLGGATYKVVKDIRSGDPYSPLAGLTGGALATTLASIPLEELAGDAFVDPDAVTRRIAQKLHRILPKQNANRLARRVVPWLETMHSKYNLITGLLMTLGGGAAAYGLSKHLQNR